MDAILVNPPTSFHFLQALATFLYKQCLKQNIGRELQRYSAIFHDAKF
jgi:hypothetical protein